MLTLTSFTWCSSAIRSSTGATAWHGPHHSAQKSTITLPSLSRTSVEKVSVVAFVAISSFRCQPYGGENGAKGCFLPGRYCCTHVRGAPGQARSSGAGAGDPGALGARADLRAAPGTQPRRPDRKSTRLNSSHMSISYAVFCLKKKKKQ